MVDVTLATNCYEHDWEAVLTTDCLKLFSERNSYQFADRILTINNVVDYDKVCWHADKALEQQLITRYIVVKDYAVEALEFFQLTMDSNNIAYKYSIDKLVNIYLCQTKYILHFCEDSIPQATYNWIPGAISQFDINQQVKAACLSYGAGYPSDGGDFHVEPRCFSDHCYLIRTTDLRAPIYNEPYPTPNQYPSHAGDSFEKRVNAWMENHGYMIATYKHGRYDHRPI